MKLVKYKVLKFFVIIAWSILCFKLPADSPENSLRRPEITVPPAPLSLNSRFLQPMPKGTIFFFIGADFRKDWQTPLSGYKGDLHRYGVIRFDFFFARTVALQIRGAINQTLGNKTLSEYSAIKAKSVNDVGDFFIATVANIIPAGNSIPAMDLRIESKLPNTDQNKGLGSNTTDVNLSVISSYVLSDLFLFADIGVGILTAPRQLNEQNDVLLYGFGFIWNQSNKLIIAGEISGFLSTRSLIPRGTEDRGVFQLGMAWKLGRFSVEFFPQYGLTGRDGSFGAVIGASTRLNIFTR